jgi:hypothetical protein
MPANPSAIQAWKMDSSFSGTPMILQITVTGSR